MRLPPETAAVLRLLAFLLGLQLFLTGCGPTLVHGPGLSEWRDAARPTPCMVHVDQEGDGVWDQQSYFEPRDGPGAPHRLFVWCIRKTDDGAGYACESPGSLRLLQGIVRNPSGRVLEVAEVNEYGTGYWYSMEYGPWGRMTMRANREFKRGGWAEDWTQHWDDRGRPSSSYRNEFEGGHTSYHWDGVRFLGWSSDTRDLHLYESDGQYLYDENGNPEAFLLVKRYEHDVTWSRAEISRSAGLGAWIAALPYLSVPGWRAKHSVEFVDEIEVDAPDWSDDQDAFEDFPRYWDKSSGPLWLANPDVDDFVVAGDLERPVTHLESEDELAWVEWDIAGDLVRERFVEKDSNQVVELHYQCSGPPRVSTEWSDNDDSWKLRQAMWALSRR